MKIYTLMIVTDDTGKLIAVREITHKINLDTPEGMYKKEDMIGI